MDKFMAVLKDPLTSCDKNTPFFVKKNKFQILNIPGLGTHDVLVLPVKDNEERKNLLTCIYKTSSSYPLMFMEKISCILDIRRIRDGSKPIFYFSIELFIDTFKGE